MPVSTLIPIATDVLVLKNGQQLGPFTLEEINRQLSEGAIIASDLAWHEGLSEWVPLTSIPGVVFTPAHGLRPPPPPIYTRDSPTVGPASTPSSNGVLIAGYICAAVSLLFLPPVLGLAGVVCGVVAIKRQQINQGATLLVVSFACAAIGMLIGAAMS